LALTGANWRQLALTDDHCRGAEVPKCAIAELQWVRFAKTREAVAPGCMGLHPVAHDDRPTTAADFEMTAIDPTPHPTRHPA